MPNFDGGHYFLTALVPVRQGLTTDPAGTDRILSHVHAIKEVLASLPTENQNPYGPADADLAAEEMLRTAPFSRDLRTHLARMVVIDDVAYNGRQHQDAIRTALRGPNPVLTEAVDHLPWSYLAFISDFDAADGSPATLSNYLRGLWSVMGYELGAVFEHCQGFDPAVGEASFVALIEKCQIETTMSFNDYYWSGQGQGEKLLWQGAGGPVSRSREALVPPGLALLALGLLAFWSGLRGWLLLLALLAALAAAIYWLYRRVLSLGFSPFPTAPRSDLPSVLKALYLQRRFIRFMVQNQGQSPEALKAAFADFVAEHRPQDSSAPTQKPATYFS